MFIYKILLEYGALYYISKSADFLSFLWSSNLASESQNFNEYLKILNFSE